MIFTSLFWTPDQQALWNQAIQLYLFAGGLLLSTLAVLLYAIRIKIGKIELLFWLVLLTTITLFVFRLGAPERSHLLEFCSLTICVHKALLERFGTHQIRTAFLTAFICITVGLIDESLQAVLPNRVFDTEDIVFNSLVVLTTLGVSFLLQKARRYFSRNN